MGSNNKSIKSLTCFLSDKIQYNDIYVYFNVIIRNVHKVSQWDEKGVMKIFEALKSVVSEYINDVQRVSKKTIHL